MFFSTEKFMLPHKNRFLAKKFEKKTLFFHFLAAKIPVFSEKVDPRQKFGKFTNSENLQNFVGYVFLFSQLKKAPIWIEKLTRRFRLNFPSQINTAF